MVRSAKTRQLKPVIVTLGEGSSSVVGKVPYQLGVQGLYTPTGMRIVKVTPGSPADKSGLKAGDFLVRIDDQPIVNQLALQKAVQTSGGEIQLLVRKSGGQTVQLKTKLAGGGDREAFQLGISYSIRPEGLRADTVLANSPAARAGLRRGDIILNINGQRIRTEKDYQTALENSAGYLELIVRSSEDGQSRRVLVDLVARGPFDR
jgi:S1-C subfamily serine protease